MRLKWSPMGKSYDLLSLIFVFQKISVRKCIEISLVNLSWILRFLSSPTESPTVNSRRGGGYFRNFWVGMYCWDPGTLNLYQS